MNDKIKTKDQLIAELNALRKRLSELEGFEEERVMGEKTYAASREIDLEKLTKPKQATLEERYRALFENNPMETIIVDHQGRVTSSNLAKGRPDKRVPNIGEIMYKDYAGKHDINMYNELMKCMSSGLSREFPKQKYGERFLHIRISPFSDGAMITSMDITDRVVAEETMRKAQKQARVLAHALDSWFQPFAVAYADGRIMTYNAAYCKLTGYSKEELCKVRRFTDITPKEWHDVMAEAEETIRRTKQPQHFEKEYIRKDGSRVPVEVFEYPIYDRKGNLQYFYSFFVDIKERKNLEEALEESRKRHRVLLESIPAEAIIVDHDGRVTDSNLPERRPGGSVPNVGDVMYKDYAGRHEIDMHQELMGCITSGETKEFPQQKYGEKFLYMKMSPFSGGAIITSMDVTELKLLQEALQDSEERYQSVFENTGAATAIIEKDDMLSRVNREFEKLSGYSREELEGKMKWTEFILQEDVERLKSVLAERPGNKGKSPADYEFRFVDKAGNTKDVVWKVLVQPGGEKCIVSLLDISARKKAEAGLQEREERFHAVADYAYNWETWVGPNGELIYVSPSCERITGFGPNEFKKNPGLLEAITHPEDRPLITSHLKDDFEDLESRTIEFRITSRSGEERWICHNCQPVYGTKGRFLGRRSSNRDCTLYKKIAHQLELCTVELRHANEEIAQYGNALACDLRAPLRAVRNYANFLSEAMEGTLEEDHKSYLDGIARAAREAGDLIGDLLALSQARWTNDIVERIHVGEFLRNLIASLQMPKDVRFIVEDDWPTIEAQPFFLSQIFQNLVDNAVKFNKSSQKLIELGWRAIGNEAYEFYVQDNGIGIHSRYSEQIFGVFERLHTTEEYPGSGIGLAIVKKAATKMGGSVRFESRLGEGSAFFVTLPLRQRERSRQTPQC